MPHTCQAPIDDAGHLCGRPATEERTVGGIVWALCAVHAREVDSDADAQIDSGESNVLAGKNQ